MAQLVFRHGARHTLHSEIIQDWADYDTFLQNEGYLTNVGMRQLYNLGTLLRKEYIEQKQLLSP